MEEEHARHAPRQRKEIRHHSGPMCVEVQPRLLKGKRVQNDAWEEKLRQNASRQSDQTMEEKTRAKQSCKISWVVESQVCAWCGSSCGHCVSLLVSGVARKTPSALDGA